MISRVMLFSLCLFLSTNSIAQYQIGLIPRSSPDCAIYQKVGFTDIEIKYGSPKVNKREVWGDLVPYNKVWRAGANKATTFSFGTDVLINGHLLEEGIYSFFILPTDGDEWIGIFNKVADQWGSFNYDQAEDAMRITLTVKDGNEHKESLSYRIHSLDTDKGSISLEWGSKSMNFDFAVNYMESFISTVNSRAADTDKNIKWVLYLQAAEHLVERKEKTPVIMEWLEKSESYQDSIENWNEQFYPRGYIEAHRIYTKALHFANVENTNDAMELMRSLENTEYALFYERNREEIENYIEAWGE